MATHSCDHNLNEGDEENGHKDEARSDFGGWNLSFFGSVSFPKVYPGLALDLQFLSAISGARPT